MCDMPCCWTSAVVTQDYIIKSRKLDDCIYSAELPALDIALEFALTEHLPGALVIPDYLLALHVLPGSEISHLYLFGIFYQLDKMGSENVFCRVRSHVGIPGNEMADQGASQPSLFLILWEGFLQPTSTLVCIPLFIVQA